jgi:hypothetical protein
MSERTRKLMRLVKKCTEELERVSADPELDWSVTMNLLFRAERLKKQLENSINDTRNSRQ